MGQKVTGGTLLYAGVRGAARGTQTRCSVSDGVVHLENKQPSVALLAYRFWDPRYRDPKHTNNVRCGPTHPPSSPIEGARSSIMRLVLCRARVGDLRALFIPSVCVVPHYCGAVPCQPTTPALNWDPALSRGSAVHCRTRSSRAIATALNWSPALQGTSLLLRGHDFMI